MSASVDDEVVRMRFDNSAFERGVAATLGTLDKLKHALGFSGAGKGLDEVAAKARGIDMSGANKSIDESAHHWSAWRTAGLIAFATVVHRAVAAGINVTKAFTVDPIKAGFENYETQINAVQTILANTGLKGKAGLGQVNTALGELNTYANQTIYNFSEMARNIGTFTAAGVKLQPATNAIKGIANLAALSGSNSQQASTAMYQLSQAIAANKVGLQDWNSVVNAGMGGKVFQKALFDTGVAMHSITGVKMGTTFEQWTKAGNTFRGSLKDGWLTGKVLTSTLSQFTGDLTDAQLKSMGYNAAQIKQIQEMAQTANKAATQIKTYTQLKDALKEEVATAYAAVFKTLFGDINGATKLFSALHVVLENGLTRPIYALNRLLQAVDKLGGRTKVIHAFSSVFHSLGMVMQTIKGAFRDIFPATTARNVMGFINLFSRFAGILRDFVVQNRTAIANTFRGIFAVFDIGKQIIGAVFHLFGMLFAQLSGGSSGVLNFTGHIGLMLVAFDKALKQGGLLRNAIQIIGNVLSSIGHIVGIVAHAIGQIFSGFSSKDATGITNSVTGAGDALGRLANLTQHMSDWFGTLQGKIQPAITAVVHGFQKIGSAIAQGLGSAAFGNILSGIQTGLLGGILLLLKKFFAKGINIDIGHGFLGQAKEALEGVTGGLKAMQTQLKAKALMEIGIAIGLLAASVLVLSLVDPKKMSASLKAMGVAFGELLGAMAILTKISGTAGFVKIPIMAASLDMLAVAILLLTAAVAAMAQLSWSELERGLTAIGALLAGLSVASTILSSNSAGMIRSGIGIAAIAVALNLLFLAVKGFSTMSWNEIWKGLSAVGAGLGGLAIAMRLMPRGMTLQAAAILLIATALNALYFAVKDFAKLSWGQMLKGLTGVAGGIAAIAVGMRLMPRGMVLQAAALNLIALALQGIARAVGTLGKMSWMQIARGLTALAGALAILAGGLYLMEGAIPGAAALLIVSAALRIFVPVLTSLANMSWGDILKGLGALALSFAAIGISALLLTPVIPVIFALGVALGVVGLAMVAFGGGAALLGIGLTAIAASGGAAMGILLSGLKSLIAMLPQVATALATAFVNFMTIIGKNAPTIIGAFVKLLNGLLQAVPQIMPSLVKAMISLIDGFLQVITLKAPDIIKAGLQLLMDLLKGISDNIGSIVGVVSQIVVKFLNALASHITEIIKAGTNLLVKFLLGIASNLSRVVTAGGQIIAHLITGVGNVLTDVITAGANATMKFIRGIGSNANKVITAGVDVIISFIRGIGRNAVRLANAALDVIVQFINGVADAIDRHAGELRAAGGRLAFAILDGMTGGLLHKAGGVYNAVSNLAGNMVGTLESGLHIHSPSRITYGIGEFFALGLANGIDGTVRPVLNAVSTVGSKAVDALRETFGNLSSAMNSDVDVRPVISPVLDLSQVQKDASKIGDLIATSPINPVMSYSQASDISDKQRTAAEAAAASSETPVAANVQLTQNNYSPKALSTIDIYRQTNNQLSLAKKAIGVPANT